MSSPAAFVWILWVAHFSGPGLEITNQSFGTFPNPGYCELARRTMANPKSIIFAVHVPEKYSACVQKKNPTVR